MYTISQAKKMLSQLVKEAALGKRVIITRSGVPVAELVAVKSVKGRKPGTLKGILTVRSGAFDSLTGRELKSLGFE
jgi:prevent-host-death family protein